MKKIRRFLLTSSLLALQSVAAPLSASAQVIWVHRKYYQPTGNHFYTTDINEGSEYSLEAANYFGLASNDSGGSWWTLDRYFNFYVTPAQHIYVGDRSTSPKSNLPNLRFEGTLGYYYPHQSYQTCTFSYLFINCIPNCNELQCPSPPGLRPLYSLTYYGDTNIGKRHYLFTTSKGERDSLLKTTYRWQCDSDTAGETGPPNSLSDDDCVLGFVY